MVSSSPRAKNSATPIVCAFAGGAKVAGCSVEYVNLRDLEFAFCVACMGYHKRWDGVCFMRDNVDALVRKIRVADVSVLLFIYFCGPDAPLKAVIDRTNPLLQARACLQGRLRAVLRDGGAPGAFERMSDVLA